MGPRYKIDEMRLFFFTIFMIGISATVTSQIDDKGNIAPPEGFKIPIEKIGDKTKTSPFQPILNASLTDPKYRKGFWRPIDFSKDEKKPLTMSTDHGLKQRIITFEPNYFPQYKDSGGGGNQSTQYLGEFTSTGKFVEIYCRDHEYVDGDRVRVLVNGQIVARSITLSGNFKPVLITLEKGLNRIEIKALNEGISSPNTAEFVIYDQMGNVITQNRWNLASGVKASILINKP